MNSVPPTLPPKPDNQHLRLLSIFHYVLAGMSALFALFPIFHLGFGLFLVLSPERFGNATPPLLVGWFFVAIAAAFLVAGWAFALIVFLAGRFLAARRNYTYCFVVACIECLMMPLGTVLGVFTILVLMRPEVKEQFSPRPW